MMINLLMLVMNRTVVIPVALNNEKLTVGKYNNVYVTRGFLWGRPVGFLLFDKALCVQ